MPLDISHRRPVVDLSPADMARGRLVQPVAVTLLVLVAAAAVAVGAFVPSMVVAAVWGFGLASTALVAYAVSCLGVLREVERLLRFWSRF